MNTEAEVWGYISKRPEADQTRMVLYHLFFFGPISDNMARDKYGINRLADVIWKLRRRGFNIDCDMMQKPNRWGRPVRYGVYRLA